MSSSEVLEWKFCQVFGDRSPVEEVSDVDIVSAVEFDESGDYIATGDRGGRVVIFEKCQDKQQQTKKKDVKPSTPEYKFHVEFQSHEPEFDYLKSLEIEEKINKIKWLNRSSNGHFLLTTNDKTIKLWKVFEKKVKQVISTNVSNGAPVVSKLAPPPVQSIKFPRIQTREVIVTAQARRVYANAHAYHINSISVNSDGETYISSDDLRINLWNLAVSDQSFNIVDIKPVNMEELTEVITSAEFHPQHCNIFMYSSSKGTIKLADMRASALCDQQAKVFEEEEDPANKSFFSEIISSISDIKFSHDGRYILSRDYLTLKLWDINMDSKPVKSIPIHDYLRSKLCDLYENDCIFDKFECTLSGDGSSLLTGSYHNYFHIYNQKNDVCIEASKFSVPKKQPKGIAGKVKAQMTRGKKDTKKNDEINPDTIDYTKKALHVAWHPKENLIAVGAANNLYLYAA
jgi:serine/threonine-protein phosphatase 2A regulatory subunit B